MRALLLVTTLMFTTLAAADDSMIEMLTWSEYQALSAVNQDAYLTQVGEALGQFEVSSNEVFDADRVGSYPFFREIFAEVLDEALPKANAAESDDPCQGVSFTVDPAHPDEICKRIDDGRPRCSTMENAVLEITRCRAQLNKSPDALAQYKKWVKNSSGQTAEAQQVASAATEDAPPLQAKMRMRPRPNSNGIDPNSMRAQETGAPPTAMAARAGNTMGTKDASAVAKPDAAVAPAAPAAPATPAAPVEPAAPAANTEPCNPPSPQKKREMRTKYRVDPKAKCLLAGVESSYPSGSPNGRCSLQPKIILPSKKVFNCSDKNSYGKTGKLGEVPAGRRTFCRGELFCAKTPATEPFCVEASRSAFAKCKKAVKENRSKLQFGAACVGNDPTKYKAILDSVNVICDKEVARSLLCKDCNALRAAINKASGTRARAQPAAKPTPPAATTTGQ